MLPRVGRRIRSGSAWSWRFDSHERNFFCSRHEWAERYLKPRWHHSNPHPLLPSKPSRDSLYPPKKCYCPNITRSLIHSFRLESLFSSCTAFVHRVLTQSWLDLHCRTRCKEVSSLYAIQPICWPIWWFYHMSQQYSFQEWTTCGITSHKIGCNLLLFPRHIFTSKKGQYIF